MRWIVPTLIAVTWVGCGEAAPSAYTVERVDAIPGSATGDFGVRILAVYGLTRSDS